MGVDTFYVQRVSLLLLVVQRLERTSVKRSREKQNIHFSLGNDRAWLNEQTLVYVAVEPIGFVGTLVQTFLREMIPSLLSLSVEMENMAAPSSLVILYVISALTPRSSSFALIFPTAFPTGADSGTYS